MDATPPGHERHWRWISLALKAALGALLLFALTHPDWGRFADKAMGARAATYPIAALLVPAVWAFRRLVLSPSQGDGGSGSPVRPRRGPHRFPWEVDALLVAPFVIDVAGNAANLYDNVSWFDDACHFGNWALLTTAVGTALRRGVTVPSWMLALCCAGIGAIAAIAWEVAEYLTFIMNTPETVGIYRDTIGDEVLGLTGAVLAGVITAVRARAARSRTAGGLASSP